MSKSIEALQKIYATALEEYKLPVYSRNLYEPLEYLLSIGGKRIRPTMALAGCDLFDGDIKVAVPAAHAVEYFHNFSLMHDDIMDKAELRRNQMTVHKKYNVDTAILSGDVMLIYAYRFLQEYSADLMSKLFVVFNDTAIQICEGQQMDVDFETSDTVTIEDYLKMITYKTAVLLGSSLKFGAMIAGANEKEAHHLYEFGKNIGIAFQVQDDILDVFASSIASGKMEGGDILQKKKTYLYLKSLELGSEVEKKRLLFLYSDQKEVQGMKLVEEVRAIFNSCHVKVYAQELKMSYQDLGMSHLNIIQVPDEKKQVLKSFAASLLDRKS